MVKAKKKKKIKYPATHIVHWMTDPHYACEKHANQLVGVGGIMGGHIVVSLADKGYECINCKNEAKKS